MLELRVAATVLAIIASLPAAPPPAGGATTPSAPRSVADCTIATTETARACGRRIEATTLRTETTQTFVNANGTTTVELSASPRRVRGAGGSWRTPDPSLRRGADGTITPMAAARPMTFSGGGKQPIARMSSGAQEIAVSWPAALPTPRLSGATATYPDVLTGVDLAVTADVDGFSHVLVVKDRAAAANPALRELTFGLTARGLTVVTNSGGGLEAQDPTGRTVFAAPAPMMWDSGGTGEPAGRRQAVMATRVSGDALVITPDRALLEDPATHFPLFIDPSWTGRIAGNAWTSVWSKYGGSSFWQNGTALNNASTYGGAGAGRTEDCDGCADHLVRSIFRMDVSAVRGKLVSRAVFRVQQRHAWTCSPSSNAKLWFTGAISPSTTWDNQPAWRTGANETFQTPANRKLGAAHSCSDVGDIEFNVTALIQRGAQAGWADVTLGLRAVDENTLLQWKRFNASTPVLAIDYNTVPNTPDGLTVDGRPCVSGAGRPVISTATPTLRAHVGDPDGQSMQVWFAYAERDAAGTGFVDIGGGKQDNVPNGGYGQLTATGLRNDGIYTFRAQVNDYAGGVSAVTHSPGNCEWRVDLTDPVASTVTADLYREGAAGCPPPGCGGVGQTGSFTFASSADVVSFRWGFSDPPATVVTSSTPGRPVTVAWTPPSGGAKTLYVHAVDQSGRTSRRVYQFTVAGLSPPVARWRLDEPAGATILADSSGAGHVAVLAGGATGARGRVPGGDTALSVTAGTGRAATAGPVVDTSRSFTVSAWVRLTDRTRQLVFAQQKGTAVSSFQFEYKEDLDTWAYSFSGTDTNPAVWYVLRGTTRPVLDVWTHLTGVYDSAAREARLYVNGRLDGTRGGITAWNSSGQLSIGTNGGGALSDLSIWSRVLADNEIAAMVDPFTTANVGRWNMDEVGPGPAFDSSGRGNDLTFLGGAAIPPGGSGQNGTGLHLDGVTGRATTTRPVVYTDQSFTVAAWVRVGDGDPSTPAPDLPIGNRTAISQGGAWVSGFFLGSRYSQGVSRWGFTMKDSDSDDGPWVAVLSPTPLTTADVGRWVHLVGVYDAAAAQTRLYVDGSLVSTATRSARWHADGPLTIGSALWSPVGDIPRIVDPWVGDLDEVRAYAGAVNGQSTQIP